MFFITVKAVATNSFPPNITPSCWLLRYTVTTFGRNKKHSWSNGMGNGDWMETPNLHEVHEGGHPTRVVTFTLLSETQSKG